MSQPCDVRTCEFRLGVYVRVFKITQNSEYSAGWRSLWRTKSGMQPRSKALCRCVTPQPTLSSTVTSQCVQLKQIIPVCVTLCAALGRAFSVPYTDLLFSIQHGLGLATPPTTFLGVSPPRRSGGASNPIVQVHYLTSLRSLRVSLPQQWVLSHHCLCRITIGAPMRT